MKSVFSNCCNAQIVPETDVCSKCLEHCEIISVVLPDFKVGDTIREKYSKLEMFPAESLVRVRQVGTIL